MGTLCREFWDVVLCLRMFFELNLISGANPSDLNTSMWFRRSRLSDVFNNIYVSAFSGTLLSTKQLPIRAFVRRK